MTSELVKTLLTSLLNFPEDVNVIDWAQDAGTRTLSVKVEGEDGMVDIFTIGGSWKGYASTLNVGDFTVARDDDEDGAHCFEG